MQSIISMSVNQEGQECVSIGSMEHLKGIKKNCKQLVCMLAWNHTEVERIQMKALTQEELYSALMNAINKNPLHVLYLN